MKKMRRLVAQSDATRLAAPLEAWSKCIDKWESNVEDIRACCVAMGASLKGIPNMNAFEVDNFCRDAAASTKNLANRMQRSMSLLLENIVANALQNTLG